MKTIMVIPGANAQIPLIKSIKKQGYSVVCVNPYEDSPAFEYADYSEQYDIMDVENCIKVAKKYNVCAVLSDECDIAMPSLAKISEALGLPSIGSDLAKLYTNKEMMREFSEKNGFPYTPYKQCANLDEAKSFFNSLKSGKMIIKPLDSNSSRGVYTVTSEQELDDYFNESLSYSRSVKAVLCEEFIDGTEFTIDGVVINGKHYCLAISEKDHYKHHPNIACELYFSNHNDKFDYEKLMKLNNAYVEATKLPFGFTHAEYKFNGEEFILIEIGARGGGNFISSHIVPIMSGIDNYKILVDEILGKNTISSLEKNPELYDRCSVLKFFDIPQEDNGKGVKSVLGEEILKDNPKIALYSFNFEIGEKLYTASDDSKRVGFYIAYGDTKAELDELMKEIETNVKFVFE